MKTTSQKLQRAGATFRSISNNPKPIQIMDAMGIFEEFINERLDDESFNNVLKIEDQKKKNEALNDNDIELLQPSSHQNIRSAI